MLIKVRKVVMTNVSAHWEALGQQIRESEV